MASVSKKRKVDREGRRFQDKWKFEYFFTEILNNCVCLICQETVAVFKEFNIKRHYQTKHASYDKLTGNKRGEKVKQLEAVLTAQQSFFTRVHHLQLELIELQCDAEHRSRHQQLPLVNFYRQLDEGRFQAIRTFAKKMLSLFGSTYMCEKTFSVMNINKSRMRTRLSDSHLRDVLRIKTTALEPDMDYILQSRSQYHPSH
ncbi:general transcription factor II-I repeat domain-containing protein 2B-like [Syngnathoides biaculeatus]|uniref:general transcription factor II-I repeat domain-containing protein 2B-like n=1 Tax=Syngnathoides biaculeatus TaxID=300417 RepID=UPI002ADD791F|nr:general transcription factor II-I repeat domain-containing protein 2B-like [Syngnathoides biaculeatus]